MQSLTWVLNKFSLPHLHSHYHVLNPLQVNPFLYPFIAYSTELHWQSHTIFSCYRPLHRTLFYSLHWSWSWAPINSTPLSRHTFVLRVEVRKLIHPLMWTNSWKSFQSLTVFQMWTNSCKNFFSIIGISSTCKGSTWLYFHFSIF